MIEITNKQKDIINNLNHSLYTFEFLLKAVKIFK